MDVYGHVLPNAQKQAMGRLGDLLSKLTTVKRPDENAGP
jgi:hypothetical protein